MMNRLAIRLSLAFLLVAMLAIGAIAIIVRTTTENSFRSYVNQRNAPIFSDQNITELETYYAENGSWEGVESLLPRGSGSGAGRGQGRGAGGGSGGTGTGGAAIMLAGPDRTVLASTQPERVGQTLDDNLLESAIPLVVEGVHVGWLTQETPGQQALGSAENRFLDETMHWLVIAAIGAGIFAVAVGGLLAWQLTRPMRALTHTAHELAEGRLGKQVNVSGATELQELGIAFNRMSHDLAEGETLRQRMAADIAHELRTPVSVLRGHLEAMLDGIYPLDVEHLAVAYDRTLFLSRLVDDLRILTRAEAGQLPLELVTMSPETLIAQLVESFTPLALDSEVTLAHDVAPSLPQVRVDKDRIQQVFGNLLTNALRHTPPGGTIRISASRAGSSVRFRVANTGDEIPPEQAAHVFTPFWRAESARERDKGGSGLGLAIAQQLIRLHNGRIWVERQPGQTVFAIDLPAIPA